jgi:hypothetical protein
MLNAIFRSIFGTKHERDVKRMRPVVDEIAALEPGLQPPAPPSCAGGWPTGPSSTICCRKPSRRFARRRGGRCACGTSTSR